MLWEFMGFPGRSTGKQSAWSAGDLGSINGWGRSPGEWLGYPLHYSWASLVPQTIKNPPAKKKKNPPAVRETLEEGIATVSSILSWRISMDSGAWRDTFHWVTKSRTQLSD